MYATQVHGGITTIADRCIAGVLGTGTISQSGISVPIASATGSGSMPFSNAAVISTNGGGTCTAIKFNLTGTGFSAGNVLTLGGVGTGLTVTLTDGMLSATDIHLSSELHGVAAGTIAIAVTGGMLARGAATLGAGTDPAYLRLYPNVLEIGSGFPASAGVAADDFRNGNSNSSIQVTDDLMVVQSGEVNASGGTSQNPISTLALRARFAQETSFQWRDPRAADLAGTSDSTDAAWNNYPRFSMGHKINTTTKIATLYVSGANTPGYLTDVTNESQRQAIAIDRGNTAAGASGQTIRIATLPTNGDTITFTVPTSAGGRTNPFVVTFRTTLSASVSADAADISLTTNSTAALCATGLQQIINGGDGVAGVKTCGIEPNGDLKANSTDPGANNGISPDTVLGLTSIETTAAGALSVHAAVPGAPGNAITVATTNTTAIKLNNTTTASYTLQNGGGANSWNRAGMVYLSSTTYDYFSRVYGFDAEATYGTTINTDGPGTGALLANKSNLRVSVQQYAGMAVTTLEVDFGSGGGATGYSSVATMNSPIGHSGDAAQLFVWRDALNGILYKTEMVCVETPGGGGDLRCGLIAGTTGAVQGGAAPGGLVQLVDIGSQTIDWVAAAQGGVLEAQTGTTRSPIENGFASAYSLPGASLDGKGIYLGCDSTTTPAASAYSGGKFVITMYGASGTALTV